jgi:hypothetical protein
MIFISKNHKGEIISIVSAADIKSVNAYNQGNGIDVNSVTEFDPDEIRENEEMGYVTPILKTQKKTLSPFAGNPVDYIVVVK